MEVRDISIYNSFEEAISDVDFKTQSVLQNASHFKKLIPSTYTKEEVLVVYHNIPNYTELSKKYGVVSFKLQRVYLNDFIDRI